MLKKAEPILQSVTEFKKTKSAKAHFDANGNPQTVIGLMIHTLRLCGPESIHSFFELFLAMTVFFYIMLLVRLFGVDGFTVVNRPKFTKEYESIHSIVGKKQVKKIEDKKKA